jgi:hypothetical protein
MSTALLTEPEMAAAPLPENPEFQPEVVSYEKSTAEAIEVLDSISREVATVRMVGLKALIEKAHETFDPICATAFTAHKTATAKRAGVLEPLESAYRTLGGRVANFDLQERRRQEAEQQRQIAEARRVAQEDRNRQLAEAAERAALEREQKIEEAEIVSAPAAEVAELCAAPISAGEVDMIRDTPMVITSFSAPTRRNAAPSPVSSRFKYRGVVTDKMTVLKHIIANPHYLHIAEISESNLNKLVSAMGAAFKFPGVQLTEEATAVTRGARVGK